MSECVRASVAERVLKPCKDIHRCRQHCLGRVCARCDFSWRKQNSFISDPISLYLSASQALRRDLTREGLFDEN